MLTKSDPISAGEIAVTHSELPESKNSKPQIRDPLTELRGWQRFHFRLISIYGGTVFLALFMVGSIFYQLGFDSEFQGLQRRLLAMVNSLSVSIDAEQIKTIPVNGTEFTPFHQDLYERFKSVADNDPDVETIYVLRPTREPTKLRFLVDYAKDNNTGSPGEEYDAQDVPVLLKGFAAAAVEDELYADEFGVTLSGYAPIRDQNGTSVALVGVDVRAIEIENIRTRILNTVLFVFGLAALAVSLVSYLVGRSVRHPLSKIIDAAGEIAKGKLNTRIRLQRRDEFGVMSYHIDQMAEGLQEREFIRETFGRYVSENVAKSLLDHPEQLQLGGEERIVSVLFIDLRSYSTISEQMPPAQVVEMLNQYFGSMNDIIARHHGSVIEFLGDAILAVFGAPNYMSDHAEKAMRCALDMCQQLKDLNEQWKEQGIDRYWRHAGIEQLQARIGIHSGRVIAGNLGSPSRMKYAVIGDTVNVAARLETMNKELKSEVCISAEVYSSLPVELTENLRDEGYHHLKGREQTVRVYTLKTKQPVESTHS